MLKALFEEDFFSHHQAEGAGNESKDAYLSHIFVSPFLIIDSATAPVSRKRPRQYQSKPRPQMLLCCCSSKVVSQAAPLPRSRACAPSFPASLLPLASLPNSTSPLYPNPALSRPPRVIILIISTLSLPLRRHHKRYQVPSHAQILFLCCSSSRPDPVSITLHMAHATPI